MPWSTELRTRWMQGVVELARDAAVEAGVLAFQLDLDLAAERPRQLAGVAGERQHGAAQRLELQREHLLELLLGRADEPPLPALELHRDPPQHGREHGQDLRGLGLVEALLGQPGELVDALDDLAAGERHDPHLRGALGHGVERGGVDPDVAADGWAGLASSRGGLGLLDIRSRRGRRGRRSRRGGNGGLGLRWSLHGRRLGRGPRLRRRYWLRRRYCARELAEQHLVPCRLLPARHGLHHAAQLVDHAHEQRDHARRRGVEDLLGGVAELGQRGDLEHPPRALQRVELALDLDPGVLVRLQQGNAGGEPLDPVAGFLDEQRDEIGELGIHGV